MSGLKVLMMGPFPRVEGKIVGGVEAVTSTLAAALAARDDILKVMVLCFCKDLTQAERRTVHPKLEVVFLPGQRRLGLLTRSILEVIRARRIAVEWQPDIAHGQGIGIAGYIATQLRYPPVVTVHGLVHKELRQQSKGVLTGAWKVRLMDHLVKDVLEKARIVISTSNYDARSLNWLCAGKQVFIPNPILQQFFVPERKWLPDQKILFAGVLVRRKNVEGLLRAFRRVRQKVSGAELVIAGPAPDFVYLAEIQALVTGLGLEQAVRFMGHIENSALVQELVTSRLLVLFSHEETSPTIIAQAMAAGLPVVASRVGGIPEMIDDGENGFLVKPGDEKSLADSMISLLESPSLSMRLGKCSQAMARQRFEPSEIARKTFQSYVSAL